MQQFRARFHLFICCRDKDKRETICILIDTIWLWFSSPKFFPFSLSFIGARNNTRWISFHSFKFWGFSLVMFHLLVTMNYGSSAFSRHCSVCSKKREQLGKINNWKTYDTKQRYFPSTSQAWILGYSCTWAGGWPTAGHSVHENITPRGVQERGYTAWVWTWLQEDVLHVGLSMVHSNWSWHWIVWISIPIPGAWFCICYSVRSSNKMHGSPSLRGNTIKNKY